jgi:hypothetical protein
MKSGSLNLLEPSGPVKACNGIALPLPAVKAYLLIKYKIQKIKYEYVCTVHMKNCSINV